MATRAIVGEKVGMTQVWDDDNRVVPVTVLRVRPCRVVQVKTNERDGYSALQVTFGHKKASQAHQARRRAVHRRRASSPGTRLVELRLDDVTGYEVGQEIGADVLSQGELVDVTSVSKGKGTAGVMKRHGFSGLGASHGAHRVHRAPGAIGACATPSRVFRGTRMAGRIGRPEDHHPQPHRRPGRRRSRPAAGQGLRARAQGRHRPRPRRRQGEVKAMATVKLTTAKGGKASKTSVDLDEAYFDVQPNLPVMHQVVTAQLAARRAGTQSTKTRAEVRGGGAKPWRQKGTGRARQGSIRAPHWRGGGVTHAPKPRSYKQRTPKKMIRLALASALSDRHADEQGHRARRLGPRLPEHQGRRRGARQAAASTAGCSSCSPATRPTSPCGRACATCSTSTC